MKDKRELKRVENVQKLYEPLYTINPKVLNT